MKSGWPSGLRRQTQGSTLSLNMRAFWSTIVGVGSNPTSDNKKFLLHKSAIIFVSIVLYDTDCFPFFPPLSPGKRKKDLFTEIPNV